MMRDGFLRFCDNPEIACCKAERELEQLRAENASLRDQLAESQRREREAVELIGKVSQAVEVAFNATDYVKPNTGIWHTLGLALDWIKSWRGPHEAGEGDSNAKIN